MPQDDLARIARDLHIVSTLTRRVLEADLEGPGGPTTFTQFVVLKWLDAAQPRRSKHVARFLSASAPAASQILSRLKRKGLVRARTDPTDRRAEDLLLTPRGRAFVERYERLKAGRLERMLASIPAADSRRIAAGLEAAIELLLRAEPERLDLCLHCGAHASPHCVMRKHGMRCPTERDGEACPAPPAPPARRPAGRVRRLPGPRAPGI